eukprot:TRINITY_DN766_c0_g1_i1.p1 TRINITY_DN766_c0_g1~~TRINITY_DN766_c0_g1_i1.p1  ORF type:complete len:839 (-),score=187.91 TRINITY_DN766_c0_g1_i1:50-2566(-)
MLEGPPSYFKDSDDDDNNAVSTTRPTALTTRSLMTLGGGVGSGSVSVIAPSLIGRSTAMKQQHYSHTAANVFNASMGGSSFGEGYVNELSSSVATVGSTPKHKKRKSGKSPRTGKRAPKPPKDDVSAAATPMSTSTRIKVSPSLVQASSTTTGNMNEFMMASVPHPREEFRRDGSLAIPRKSRRRQVSQKLHDQDEDEFVSLPVTTREPSRSRVRIEDLSVPNQIGILEFKIEPEQETLDSSTKPVRQESQLAAAIMNRSITLSHSGDLEENTPVESEENVMVFDRNANRSSSDRDSNLEKLEILQKRGSFQVHVGGREKENSTYRSLGKIGSLISVPELQHIELPAIVAEFPPDVSMAIPRDDSNSVNMVVDPPSDQEADVEDEDEQMVQIRSKKSISKKAHSRHGSEARMDYRKSEAKYDPVMIEVLPGEALTDLRKRSSGAVFFPLQHQAVSDHFEFEEKKELGSTLPVHQEVIVLPFTAVLEGHHKRNINGSPVVFYDVYCTNGVGLSWTVSKRFSDFARLHKQLKKDEETTKRFIEVPRFKKTFEDDVKTALSKSYRVDEAFLRRRSEDLKDYVNKLTSDDALIMHPVVKKFLDPNPVLQQIPLAQIVEICEPGDVVLFRTPGLVTASYRAIIDGEWDHIGIIVPYANSKKGRLWGILEATKEGVEVYSLKSRIRNWNRFFPGIKFGFRKLNFARNEEFVENIASFVKTVQGKTYGFPISTFRFKSIAGADTSLDQSKFFCSELVAKCLKHVGLIEVDRASCTYLPHSFSLTSSEIGLVEEADFEDVVLVDMSEFESDQIKAVPSQAVSNSVSRKHGSKGRKSGKSQTSRKKS